MAKDPFLERSLPNNTDAERSVLGAVLLENAALHQAQQILREEDFYRDDHRRIFRAMGDLLERSSVIDLITVKEELERCGGLEATGGAVYLSSLVDGVPKWANIEHYARIVKEKATLRNLISSAHDIIANALNAEEGADEILDSAERSILRIAESRLQAGFVPLRTVADQSLKVIERLSEQRELITGLATGLERFDELTSGLQPGDLIVLAGRPSMGKTSLALNIAQYAAVKHKKKVGIFSLEMTKEQLFLRMLCSQAKVDAHRLRTGTLSKSDWTKLTLAFGQLAEVEVYIDDSPAIGILEMRAKARRLKIERNLDLLIVDYLQLMRGRGRYENRTQEISDISRSLKALAKELNLPLIAISQLSRAPETRGGDHRPQLSDLRESGAIEQDADLVTFVFREEVYRPSEENRGRATLIIGKQRNGPVGDVDLVFLKEYTRFENPEWRTDG
ncbi:MAG: replicative DNA helicase [Acidobacteriota bacterium]